MKIIDILNKKANGTLEDGFKFCFRDEVFTYDKNLDRIHKGDNILNRQLGEAYKLEACLNDEILLFLEEVQESEKREKNKEIEELKILDEGNDNEKLFKYISQINIKTNELARAVNKLTKESEGK